MIIGEDRQAVEIVGVMPNALLSGYRRDASLNFVLRPALQEPGAPSETTFYLKYAGSLDVVASGLSRVVHEVDAKVPVVSVRTLEKQLESSRWPVMAIITLLTVFAK